MQRPLLRRKPGLLVFGGFRSEAFAGVSLTKKPPWGTIALVVLDGELAVPCNPQSATAGSNSLFEGLRSTGLLVR